MKLNEALKPYADDQPVKLGAKYGYFYIGTVGDLRRSVYSIDDKVKKHTADMKTLSRRKLQTTLKNEPTPARYSVREMKADEPDITMQGYFCSLEKWFDTIRRQKSYFDTWTKRELKYVPFYDREVKTCEIGETTADEGVLRVVIDGYENGAFWDTDETETVPAVLFADGKEAEA